MNIKDPLKGLLDAHKKVAIIGTYDSDVLRILDELEEKRFRLLTSEYGFNDKLAPEIIIGSLSPFDKWVVIGNLHVARALRKGLTVDAVLFLDNPESRLMKGIDTIFSDWRKNNRTVVVVSPMRMS